MISFAVYRNGELLCCAGAEDLGVLSAIITWARREPDQNPNGEELDLTVGGLITAGPDNGAHVDWARVDLRRGDEIRVQICEDETSEPPFELRPAAEVGEEITRSQQNYVRRMCEKWGW